MLVENRLLLKSAAIALVFAVAALAYGVSTSRWDHVSYISGGLGLVCAGYAVFLFLDKQILGDRGGIFAGKERKVSRSVEIKQCLIASGVLWILTLIGWIAGGSG